jgi:hypothetical protein
LLMCCMMLQQNVYLLANTGLLQDWTVAFPWLLCKEPAPSPFPRKVPTDLAVYKLRSRAKPRALHCINTSILTGAKGPRSRLIYSAAPQVVWLPLRSHKTSKQVASVQAEICWLWNTYKPVELSWVLNCDSYINIPSSQTYR